MDDLQFKLEVVQRLSRIEENQKLLTESRMEQRHEERLQALENGRSRWGGIIAAASVVLSAIASLLTRHFIK